MLAKLSCSIRETLFYEALKCSRMLGIIDPYWSFFGKKSIHIIFGCGDCFTSLIRRYPAYLTEIIICKRKRFTGNCIVISALFFETFMPN